MYYVETFNLVVTTLRKKCACKVGKSRPRLCIKLARSQIHSFKTVGDVLQESFYFFQSLVAVLEV